MPVIPTRRGVESSESMIVQHVTVGVRHYELRYNRCGKKNCRVCYGRQADYCGPIGHGPYWYLCVTIKGKQRRLYIGKDLDTGRYVTEKGEIDWAKFYADRRVRQKSKVFKREHPGVENLPKGVAP